MDLDVINTFLEDKIEYCRLHSVTKSRSFRKYKIKDRFGKSKGAKSAIPETGSTSFTCVAKNVRNQSSGLGWEYGDSFRVKWGSTHLTFDAT